MQKLVKCQSLSFPTKGPSPPVSERIFDDRDSLAGSFFSPHSPCGRPLPHVHDLQLPGPGGVLPPEVDGEEGPLLEGGGEGVARAGQKEDGPVGGKREVEKLILACFCDSILHLQSSTVTFIAGRQRRRIGKGSSSNSNNNSNSNTTTTTTTNNNNNNSSNN